MDDLSPVLDQIIRSIWDTTLGLPIVRVPGDPVPSWTEPPLTASVEITGQWHGRVILSTPEALVHRIARHLFGSEPATLERSDLEDSLRELVNITGGNLKSCLPQPCHLALPVMVRPDEEKSPSLEPGASAACRLSFVCEEQPLMVTVCP